MLYYVLHYMFDYMQCVALLLEFLNLENNWNIENCCGNIKKSSLLSKILERKKIKNIILILCSQNCKLKNHSKDYEELYKFCNPMKREREREIKLQCPKIFKRICNRHTQYNNDKHTIIQNTLDIHDFYINSFTQIYLHNIADSYNGETTFYSSTQEST